MRGAIAAAMDQIFFGLKRAFHRTLRVGQELTAEYGLTPARFDLLCAMKDWHHTSFGVPLSQRLLRDILGVSAATLSRMLRSLEKLWLVWRGPREGTLKSSRELRLTPRGFMLIRRAAKDLYRRGRARRIIDSAMRRGPTKRDDFEHREWLDDMLDLIRKSLGDVAWHSYPWHPDD